MEQKHDCILYTCYIVMLATLDQTNHTLQKRGFVSELVAMAFTSGMRQKRPARMYVSKYMLIKTYKYMYMYLYIYVHVYICKYASISV